MKDSDFCPREKCTSPWNGVHTKIEKTKRTHTLNRQGEEDVHMGSEQFRTRVVVPTLCLYLLREDSPSPDLSFCCHGGAPCLRESSPEPEVHNTQSRNTYLCSTRESEGAFKYDYGMSDRDERAFEYDRLHIIIAKMWFLQRDGGSALGDETHAQVRPHTYTDATHVCVCLYSFYRETDSVRSV